MMVELVYMLCAATSAACAFLLLRSWWSGRSRILLWSGACFAGLGCSNALLVVDLVLLPTQADLSILRAALTACSMLVLVFGLIWDAR